MRLKAKHIVSLALLVLPSPGLALWFFWGLDRTANPWHSLFYNLFLGVFSSLAASGIVVVLAYLFRDTIRQTFEEILGYDKTPDDLADPMEKSIRLAIAVSSFSTALQRVIDHRLPQELADKAHDIDTQARDLNSSLGVAFERAKQRVDHKNALTQALGRRTNDGRDS